MHYYFHVLILIFIIIVTPTLENLKDYFSSTAFVYQAHFLNLPSWSFLFTEILELNRRTVCQFTLPKPFKRYLNIMTFEHSTFWCHKYQTMILSYAGGKRGSASKNTDLFKCQHSLIIRPLGKEREKKSQDYSSMRHQTSLPPLFWACVGDSDCGHYRASGAEVHTV